jgi:hypothetical protein
MVLVTNPSRRNFPPPMISQAGNLDEAGTSSLPDRGRPRLWIDFWVICDDTHAYCFLATTYAADEDADFPRHERPGNRDWVPK